MLCQNMMRRQRLRLQGEKGLSLYQAMQDKIILKREQQAIAVSIVSSALFMIVAFTNYFSGFFGTSPTVAAAESGAGIKSGGRTGIMAIVAGLLFALSIFFIPLLNYIPQAAIAPIIITTGAIMMEQLKYINYDSFSDWFPAFLIIVLIPFTSSISTGLSFGFVAYPLLKIFEGKARTVHPVMYVIGALFLLNLVLTAII